MVRLAVEPQAGQALGGGGHGDRAERGVEARLRHQDSCSVHVLVLQGLPQAHHGVGAPGPPGFGLGHAPGPHRACPARSARRCRWRRRHRARRARASRSTARSIRRCRAARAARPAWPVSGAPGCSSMRPSATSRASACSAATRWRTMPSRPMRSRVGAGDVGGAGEQPVQVRRTACRWPGPSSATSRRVSVRAAATVTCWPRMMRAAVSKPSIAPGTRKPAGGGTRHRGQAGVDQRRVGVQVQRMAQPLHQRARRAGSRAGATPQVQLVALRHEAALQPAAQRTAPGAASAACGAAPGRRPPRRRAARAAPGSPARRRCRRAAGRPGAGWARCRARARSARCGACLRSALGFMR